MTAFRGFPDGALDFFVELEANNERRWWLANKDRFDADVKEPMRALLDAVAPPGSTFHVFRMNRDVRFSKDKSPYKLAHAGVTEREGGATLYVQLSKAGLFVGGGVYHPARDQLARYREAVDDDRTGPALAAAVAEVREAGVEVTSGEDVLVRAPKGFSPEHPRIDLLRWKGCIASKELGAPAWFHTPEAVAAVKKVWTGAEPVFAWLDAHVGPSQETPDW
jgi:uncharacterized protein (TIGR02453 family)